MVERKILLLIGVSCGIGYVMVKYFNVVGWWVFIVLW